MSINFNTFNFTEIPQQVENRSNAKKDIPTQTSAYKHCRRLNQSDMIWFDRERMKEKISQGFS